MHSPSRAPHRLAGLLAFFAAGAATPGIPSISNWGASGLIRTSQLYRLEWAYCMLERDVRVTDST